MPSVNSSLLLRSKSASFLHIAHSRYVVSAAILAVTAPAAQALSLEAARENCRMTVGRPIVQACMRASGGAGNIEACRAQATPTVRACVMAALNAANGRANVAVAIPTEAAPKVPAGSALPAGFVAPPRTITDITAILDSEKPDLKTIEELKAEADCQPDRQGIARRSRPILFRSRQRPGAARPARRYPRRCQQGHRSRPRRGLPPS